jgi:RNA polymerase sigma factor (sigma-70 family)
MRSRDTILDLFSTFAFLEGDRVHQWIAEPRLRRNIQKSTTDPNAPESQGEGRSEKAWSLYWYKIWQVSQDSPRTNPPTSLPLSEQHLAAYLQEPCYWTAYRTAQRFPQLEYSLADYFQLISSETHRILKGFNPSFGTNLKSYAPIVLTNILKDYLRQRRAIDVCSDWAILRKVSQKRVKDVLLHTGVSPEELEQYSFAWTCFKTICVPTTASEKISQPLKTQWETIANLYNRRNPISAPSLTAAQLEVRMTKLTRWIREYLYPSVDSLNRIKPGQESGELQDDLSDPLGMSLLEAAIETETQQERQKERSNLHDTLTQALEDQDEAAQRILRLFYQENLSQQELAARMEMSQPTVSRRLKKAEEALLAKLLESVKRDVNKFPDPSELKHISFALKEWLGSYYHPS